jgi:T5SS/PEP-CTERM-associated repeat protein
MNPDHLPPRYCRALVACLGVLLSTTVHAQINYWNDSGSYDWSIAGAWSLGIRPANTHWVFITNATTKTVAIDTTTSGSFPASLTVSNLSLWGPDETINTLYLNNSGLAVPLTVSNDFTIGAGGVLWITNGAVSVLSSDSGVFSVDGIVRLDTGTITVTNSSTIIGDTGTSALTNYLGLVNLRNVVVGNAAGSRGSLTLAGGTNLFDSLTVGNVAGSTGSALVVGADLFVTTGVGIGNSGSANQMTITNGGQVFSASGQIGQNAGASYNAVLVSGNGSVWNNSGTLIVGHDGSSNSLSILSGGVVSNDTGYIGYNPGASNNAVLVSDNGSVWNNSGQLRVGVYGSANRLSILSGGVVSNDTGYIGYNPGASNNTVLISGNGSVWNNSDVLYIGNLGRSNALSILNGGVVSSRSGYIGNDFRGSDNAVLVSGDGSVWSNSLKLYVGYDGSSNTLSIMDGGVVNNNEGYIGYNVSASNNTVLVSGNGAVWNNRLSLYVGYYSSFNQLSILNGGVVSNTDANIGYWFAASSNSVLVSGIDSVWNNSGSLYVGNEGSSNALSIMDGSVVNNSEGYIGHDAGANNNVVLVSGTGSVWNSSGSIYIGYQGSSNQLTIQNSGAVLATNVVLGAYASSSNNTLIVTGGRLLATNATGSGSLNVLRGTFTINSGTVAVDRLVLTGTEGLFRLDGGTVIAQEMRIGADGTFLSTNTLATLRLNELTWSAGGFSNAGWLQIGHTNGTTGAGNVSLTGGQSLFARAMNVGHDAPATFRNSNSIHEVQQTLALGWDAGASGNYELGNPASPVGSPNLAVGGSLIVGNFGTGTFNHVAGTNTVGESLYLAYREDSRGAYVLDGDQSRLTAEAEYVGYASTATFTQSGGVNNVSTLLHLGPNSGGFGTYRISGGTLDARNAAINLGGDGIGRLYLDGGTVIADTLEFRAGGTLSATGRTAVLRVNQITDLPAGFTFGSSVELGHSGGAGTGSMTFTTGHSISFSNNFTIGYDGRAEVFQLNDATITASNLYLGKLTDSRGGYWMLNGALAVSNLYVGHSGTGYFYQSGGNHTVQSILRIGGFTGGTGEYQMAGGTLDARNINITVGGDGPGRLHLGNGTVIADEVSLGANSLLTSSHTGGVLRVNAVAGRPDSFTLAGSLELGHAGGAGAGGMTVASGQTLTVGKRLVVGYDAPATFTVNDGTVIADEFKLEANGSYAFSGMSSILRVNSLSQQTGTNFTTAGSLQIGHTGGNGAGNFTISNRSLSVGGNLTVGHSASADFLQTGSTNTVGGNVTLGDASGVTGNYTLRGGKLAVGTLKIGNTGYSGTGTGTFKQEGGEVEVAINAAVELDSYNTTAPPTYQMEGGTLQATYLNIGNAVRGQFLQSGGSVNVYDIAMANSTPGSYGYYELNGAGQLAVANEYIGRNGTGVFYQTGGTHTVANRLWLGGVAGEGSLRIHGGTFSAYDVQLLTAGSSFGIESASSSVTIGNLLAFTDGTEFSAVSGSTIHMTGSMFENWSTNPTDLAGLSNLTMIFEGGLSDVDPFEIASEDFGLVMGGFDNNFALDTLQIGGADIGRLQLVNNRDNQPDFGSAEVLYVRHLIVNPGSTLDLNGYKLYYQDFTGDLGGITGGQIAGVPEPGTWMLFGGGLALLAAGRRTRAHRG